MLGKPFQAVRSGRLRFFLSSYLLFAGASILGALHQGQDVGWDLRNYHIYNGITLLHTRPFDIAPAQIQTYLNPVLDGFFAAADHWLNPKQLACLVAILQATIIVPTLRLIEGYSPRISFERGYSRWALALVTFVAVGTGATYWSELGNVMGDSIIAPLIVCSVVAFLPGSIARTSRRWIHWGALALGLAVGLKQTNALFVPGYVIAVMGIKIKGGSVRQTLRSAISLGLSMTVGFLTTGGWWAYTLFRRYQSPTFPFFNKEFRSTFWHEREFNDLRFVIRTPATFASRLARSWVTDTGGAELPYRDPRFFLVTLFAVSILLVRIRVRPWSFDSEASLATFGIVSVLIWAYLFGILRYFAPLEALCPVFFLIMLKSVGRLRRPAWSMPSPGRQQILAISTVASALLLAVITRAPNWERFHAWQPERLPVKVTGTITPGSTIVILGGDPVAYIAAGLPRKVALVRPDSNFIAPTDDVGLTRQIRSFIRGRTAARKPIYLLSPPNAPYNAAHAAFAQSYGFVLNQNKCGTITTAIEAFQFCELAPL
jgi:hypothetical protein